MKAGVIIGGVLATLISLLFLYVFIEVLQDDDPLRSTTGIEKVLAAFPGLPAAVLGLLALPLAILWAVRARAWRLFLAAVAGTLVSIVVYVLLLVIEG